MADMRLTGAFQGVIPAQQGHVLVGFTARANRSGLDITGGRLFFFRCELTQVN